CGVCWPRGHFGTFISSTVPILHSARTRDCSAALASTSRGSTSRMTTSTSSSTPSPAGGSPPRPRRTTSPRERAQPAAFPATSAEIRAHWIDFLRSRTSAGRRVAIWGGGSKGVSFLTTTGFTDEVAQVVDINPYKQGKFLPGTGHQVIGPEALKDAPPNVVIVMNPIYLPEIGAQLAEMELDPELIAL